MTGGLFFIFKWKKFLKDYFSNVEIPKSQVHQVQVHLSQAHKGWVHQKPMDDHIKANFW